MTRLQQEAQILKPLCVHAMGFSMGWIRSCVKKRALYIIPMYISGDG